METQDRIGNRTFRVNFSNDGASKLRERIRDKLKEFMGDYTDDTLVEYVIVLLRNGRQKNEARNELNVFLGDDTDNFVSWLWEHLSSNLHLYVQQQESYPEQVANTKPVVGDQLARNDSNVYDSGSDKEKTAKESRSRRKREWKGIVRDVANPPPLRSSVIEPIHFEEKKQQRHIRSSEIEPIHFEEKKYQRHVRAKRSPSPQPSVQNKRRQQERQQTKSEVPSQPTIGAPRRLLQFAVRDAVGTLRSSSLRTNTSLKRLRSVVSTSAGDSSLDDHPQRIRSVTRLPSAVSTALRAAAEAAEDVTKVRYPANVFDRLGHDQVGGDSNSDYLERHEYSELAGNTTLLDREAITAYDSSSDNDVYDDVDAVRHRVMDASDTGTSYGNKDDESLMVQYSVADNSNEVVKRTRVKDQNPPATVGNTSRKIVNISVNVNTWKPPHYQAPRETREGETLEAIKEGDAGANKSTVRLKENNNPVATVNEKEKADPVVQKESQKILPAAASSYSTGRPLEDADSRTIFINNVHFGATKDTLSRHFNKFGEVLKVVIVTDAATGQPKGSAYIEFMRKEAAELALSLNGTSFMSRILKVVRKTSAYQEASNILSWPHVARASPFTARFARVPFPRGMPSAFRARLPIKPGARSMQWKRDSPTTSVNEASGNVQNGGPLSSHSVVPLPTARNLTYVRKEAKPDGNLGPA